MSYETRKLSDIEFPVYFSLIPDPGYDISYLESQGIGGEYDLFLGKPVDTAENCSFITWGGTNNSIKGGSLAQWSERK